MLGRASQLIPEPRLLALAVPLNVSICASAASLSASMLTQLTAHSGLLTAILVIVFLLLPIAFGSIMLLSGIESPVPKRPMDAGKKSN